jgi:hypothetical protein
MVDRIITAIFVEKQVILDARKYGPFHGYKSFSALCEDLLKKEIYSDIEKRILKNPLMRDT